MNIVRGDNIHSDTGTRYGTGSCRKVDVHAILYYTVLVLYTSDMQGMLWGEPELSHVWVFDHMVFFHSHNVNEV